MELCSFFPRNQAKINLFCMLKLQQSGTKKLGIMKRHTNINTAIIKAWSDKSHSHKTTEDVILVWRLSECSHIVEPHNICTL